ncbi:MarR family transcriptional regulator [Streptomyces spiroverticillatus]|uniref:MarR family transcriptional regulator n=1 Tax=Streptomyces finlayi TaxID=67296 RepID=A0A918X1F9_9ACTN|nr:MarR family winged helix-turn-helix transcriptional regulator [Streptomyces finlayi]GHA20630.1 MarR family transcriptional regulator [Streptomyces spiroverticillatus]GHD03333.1 MarR family transcriptional regulator [Streptomyces finlayi]
MDNMVDDEMKVNRVVDSGKGIRAAGEEVLPTGEDGPAWELPFLLLSGFRSLIDRLHAELAAQGHPDARPAHGFALQAVGPDGATASEIGRRLGISKQAAGKTADRLATLGYVTTAADTADARRKIVRLTPQGRDLLTRSALIFESLRAEWAAAAGPDRVQEMEAALRTVVPPSDRYRLDAAGWLGG